MRNRYVIFLLGLLCCVSAYGDNCSKYFDHDDYSIPTSAEGNIPGGYSIRTHLRNDGDSKHYILIGGSGVSILNWSFESYFENDIESLGNIEFIHSDISVEVENSGREEDNHKSMKLHEVNCCSDIEWRVGNDRWSPNPDQNSQGSASGDFSNFYGNHTLGTIESPQISLSQVWEKIEDNKSAMIKYNQDGYIDIEFRVVFYVNASYVRERDGNETLEGYIHTATTKKIRIYRCEIGNMNIVDGETPLIDASKNLYALIEGRESPVTTSTEVKISKDSRVCQIINKYTQELSNSVIEGPIETTITPGQFVTLGGGRAGSGGGLTAGDTFNVKLKAVTGAGLCESPSIKFLTLPKPQLKGFSESDTKKIKCPTKSTLTVGYTLEDYKGYCELEGNECDLGAYGKYESVYGIEYGWRYWTNKNGYHKPITIADGNYKVTSTKEMLDYEPDGNTPGLQLPTCVLEPGVTYYFEQYVTLKNFGNMEITATAEAGTKTYYEVKLSETLDNGKLSVDISRKETCMEEDLADVVFTAKYGEDEDPKDYSLDRFKYHWKITSEEVDTGDVFDAISVNRNFYDVRKDIQFHVEMKDGCGNVIEKEATIRVNELPSFTNGNITRINENISITQMEDGSLRVMGVVGRQCKLGITDEERNKYDYFYSENSDGTELVAINGLTFNDILGNKTLYFYKRAKNGVQCLGKPVTVNFIGLSELVGNQFTVTEIFVCPGSTLPELNANNAIASATMQGVEDNKMGYLWQYSTDQVSWFDMVNVSSDGGKTAFEKEGYNGSWEKEINGTTYIRRVAIPKLEDGTVMGEYPSNSLKVSIFTKPVLEFEIDGEIALDKKCYGDSVRLSMSMSNKKTLDEQNVMWNFNKSVCINKYGYYDNLGEEGDSILKEFKNDPSDWKMEVRRNYNVRAQVDYCGEAISSKEYLVESYPMIDVTPEIGKCAIVGNEVEVKAVKDGCTCEIIKGDSVYPTVNGAATAKILLEHQTEYKFKVHVTDETTMCETVLEKSIPPSEIKERKTSVGIGPSGDTTANKVCAGSEIEIRSEKNDSDYEAYSWSVDGKTVTGERGYSYKFTPSQAGKEYVVKRSSEYYDGTQLCYTVEDEITITTYGPLTEPSISVSTDSVCNGEKVEVTVTANGGGKDGEYTLSLGEMTSGAVSKGASYKFVTDALKADTIFKASVTDASCSSSLYKVASKEVPVKVEKDLSFTLTPTPEFITEDDFKDSVISITVECVGVDKDDKLYYSLNGGKESEVTYNGVGFTVKMNLKDFEETRKVELGVRRVGKVAGCESERSFEYRLNEGFDGGDPLLVGNGKENEIEVCGGSTVDLSISNVDEITFGGGLISEMTEAIWSWYKGNSRIERTNEPNFTVEVGSEDKTATYFAVFSGKDAGGTTRKISSNKFTIKTGEGLEIGRIRFGEYPTETFVEYCKNSDATVSMTTDFNEKASLQWIYSVDGGQTWTAAPETMNGNVVTTTKTVNISVAALAEAINGKNVDRVYFRLKATDGCGTESYSDNMLLVRFRSNVSMPSPTMASTTLYGGEVEFPDSLLFGRHYNHADPYEFIGRGEVVEVGSLQKVNFKDLIHFGENSVDVIRSEKARISEEVCYSDTLHYKFNIYQKLSEPKLIGPDNEEYFCANDKNAKYLLLQNIKGGDTASYKTVWQYKKDGIDEWITMGAGQNEDLFTATIDEINVNGIQEKYQTVYIQDLKQTITVRALLTCGGDYPGGYVSSNEMTLNVYSPMKDGGIDFTKKEICYNSSIDTIKGFDVTGGSGEYTYTWQKSVDLENYQNLVNGEANDPSFAPWNSGGKYNLKETTYFRRIVTDNVCRTRDTSEVKAVFVRDSFEIFPEDVSYSRIVTNGSRASLYGVTDYSQSGLGEDQYIWWKSLNYEYQRSAVNKEVLSEVLEVPDGDDKTMVTYYAQALKGGCVSSNRIPLEIMVYNQTAGHIYIDGEDIDTKEKVICSGENGISLLSSEHAMNAEFEWYYFLGSNGSASPLQGMRNDRVTVRVSTPEVSLDTTNVMGQLKNTVGTEKYVRIFRVTKVTIDGESQSKRLYGDTITFKVVPTLESVSNALFGNNIALAGDISIEEGKRIYCLEESPNQILGTLDPQVADYWYEYKSLFGPWLYDNNLDGGFTTYYEYQKNNGEWIKDVEYDYSENKYAGMVPYTVNTNSDKLDGSYRVRRVMEDGCTSIKSNEVLLSLFDDQLNPDTVTTYAFTPDMTMFSQNNAIKTGYEVGDSIMFMSDDRNLDLVWYSDPQCTEVIMDGKTWCGIRLTEELSKEKMGDGAYIYVKARRDDCYGEAVAVPFEFGTTSDGGTIYILDSIACHNGSYGDIIGGIDANGQYVAPEYRKMEWTYGWQYKRSSSEKAVWSDIPNETGLGLSADVINEYAALSTDAPLLIRRVATNDKGRVRYSNVLTLTRYDELKPGTLSVNGKKTKFCTYDELPYVSTTSASGGKVISFYDVTWQYSINNGEWETITCFDSLYVGQMTNDLDRSVNNIVSVRCFYADACDEVESERLDITLYRENPLPRIYEVGDSCGASLVCIKLYDDGIKKFRSWNSYYVDPEDTTYTALHTGFYSILDSIFVLKGKGNATYYTLNTEDWETGCVSDTLVFYVDSMPAISQEKPIAPTAICAGSDLEIIGGAISGGSGDKTYQWQSSQTGNEEDYADMADATRADFALQGKFIKAGTYFRRIVRDMCHEHVSDAVFVDVRQMVPVSQEDITFEDFKCPNGTFTAKVDALADSLFASEYWTLGEDTIHVIGKSIQMEGFLGDSMGYRFIHYVTDTAGLTCQSDSIVVYAHNKPSIVADDNVITTENYTPCNDRKVKIEGEKLGGQYSDKIKYAWYVNGGEVIGEFGADLNVTANGDMRIVRVADNGCVKVASDTLHIEGQIVYAYDYESELSMEVVSDVTDSSVVLNIQGSKLFSESYTFDGDGVMPDVSSNNILLPYKFDTYKDSVLNIYAKQSYCVKPYAIHPLRGGVISFDGGTLLCGDEDIPSIVVTELEGVNKEVSYQWQYRNERTPDFININGATNKDYTPEAIDVATTYRRIATAGAYKSISNELTVSIRPLPTVAQADINYTADELREFGLGYKAHEYYQWIPNEEIMRVYLVDSASNADRTYWQKSYDQKEWVMASKEGGDSLLVSDMTQSVYYRYIAESACGADTSDIVNLVTMSIDPITDDQIDWRKTDTLTCSNSEKTRLEFYMDNNNSVVKKDYFYSYRVESNCNVTLILSSEIERVRPDLRDKFCYRREYIAMYDENGEEHLPTDDVTLYVTRHDTTRGLSVTRAFVLKIDHLDVTYAMSVENGPDIRVGEKETIYLNQGERVRFTPIVTTNREDSELTYHWSLEEPINTNFFSKYSGRNGKEGLTSEYESPTCFYYNGGRYPVSLTVSNGHCEAIVKDTSLYIPESSVRNYKTSMSMDPEAHIEENEEMEYLEVYPTIVFHDVTVKSNTQKVHVAKVADELGRIYRNVKFVGMVQIPMDDMDSGTYFVIVDDDEMFKVVKR